MKVLKKFTSLNKPWSYWKAYTWCIRKHITRYVPVMSHETYFFGLRRMDSYRIENPYCDARMEKAHYVDRMASYYICQCKCGATKVFK